MTGATGHINHIYENLDLHFRDIKEIYRKISYGEIPLYEKFDGQSLLIKWDFIKQKIVCARNKKNIIENGLDEYGLSLKFGENSNILNVFISAYNTLNNLFSSLEHNDLVSIFGSMGIVWFSIEIIDPEFFNCIKYDNKSIAFHYPNPIMFDFNGDKIDTGLERNFINLKNIFLSKNISSFDEYKIYVSQPCDLSKMSIDFVNNHCKNVDNLCKKYKISDNETIRFCLFKNILFESEKMYAVVPKDIRVTISRKIARFSNSKNIDDILKPLDKILRNHTENMVKYLNTIYDLTLRDIEKVIYSFTFDYLSDKQSMFLENDNEPNRIKKEFDNCCKEISEGSYERDKSWIDSIEYKIGNAEIKIEGYIFVYNNKVYKLIGKFAGVNAVCGFIKYQKKEKIINKTNVSLSSFFIAG